MRTSSYSRSTGTPNSLNNSTPGFAEEGCPVSQDPLLDYSGHGRVKYSRGEMWPRDSQLTPYWHCDATRSREFLFHFCKKKIIKNRGKRFYRRWGFRLCRKSIKIINTMGLCLKLSGVSLCTWRGLHVKRWSFSYEFSSIILKL